MKMNASIIFGALKYWLQNGKTMTALIVGLVLGLAQLNGITISEANVDMIMQFITTFSPLFAGLFIGLGDKARKTLMKVAAKNKE